MDFYRIHKNLLKWTEMPQVSYKWILPILVDNNFNVIAGNCLKDCLGNEIICVIIDNYDRDILFESIRDIETKIAEENSDKRLDAVFTQLYNFFKEVRKPKVESISLFNVKEEGLITEENYIEPPAYDFNKHGKEKPLFNEGFVLSEEFTEKIVNSKEPEIEIDLEILKDLL